MRGSTPGSRVCDMCGAAAKVETRQRSGDGTGWDRCEHHAREEAGERDGEVTGALATMAFAVALGRRAQLSDAQMLMAFTWIVEHADAEIPDLEGAYSVVEARQEASGEPHWMRTFTTLGEAVAA